MAVVQESARPDRGAPSHVYAESTEAAVNAIHAILDPSQDGYHDTAGDRAWPISDRISHK